MFDPKRFSQQIIYLRRRYKLSMEAAARACNISFAEWCKLEYGKARYPRITTIMRIAQCFGISLDVLMGSPLLPPTINPENSIPINFLTDPGKYFKMK